MDEGSTPSISTGSCLPLSRWWSVPEIQACSLTKLIWGWFWHLTWYDWYEGESIKSITGKSISMAPQSSMMAA